MVLKINRSPESCTIITRNVMIHFSALLCGWLTAKPPQGSVPSIHRKHPKILITGMMRRANGNFIHVQSALSLVNQ
jgi:hypothetical protein